jgi:AcrR family transcriptional regulator
VARQEFGRRGYAATSVEELVTLADVSSPTMYHHFNNKLGLFVAAAFDAYDRTLSGFRAVVEPDVSFDEALQAIIDAGIVMMRDEPDLAMMITTMQFELRRDPELADRLRPALLEFRAFFDDLAARAPVALRPTPQATRDLSHLLIAMLAGLATESLLMSRNADVTSMFEALRRCVSPRG